MFWSVGLARANLNPGPRADEEKEQINDEGTGIKTTTIKGA